MDVNFVPFIVLSFRYNTLVPAFFQPSKHFSNSVFDMTFSSFSDSVFISSILANRRSFKLLYNFYNRKSHGGMSGEYGSCGIFSALLLAKNYEQSAAKNFAADCSCHVCHAQKCLAHTNWNTMSDFAIGPNNFFFIFMQSVLYLQRLHGPLVTVCHM